MLRAAILFLAMVLVLGCGDFYGPRNSGSGGGGGGSDVGGGDDGGGDGGGGGDDGGGYGYGNDGPPPVPAPAIVENMAVYDQDSLEILDLDVTILPGGATLEEVNADDDLQNLLKTEALCEVTEPGYVFGDGGSTATATLRLRGHSTRRAKQKSYRIKLDDEDNLWRNHRILQLNKHPYDLTRMRNMLTFDLMKTLENMASLRTQFVRLKIDGVNHGLYTLVERYDDLYLKAHGLDKEGHLYKAEFFEQQRYPENLRNTDDPAYDVEKFEEILEIRGRDDDHAKLLGMLEDVNNLSVDINTVVTRHFERENFLTWWATNILLWNLDTNSQNYYLYSPRTTTAWYFMPWDYDGGWDFYGQPMEVAFAPAQRRWKKGISNWWNCTLQKRFIMDPENLSDLMDRVLELKDEFYTVERTRGLLDSYRTLVFDDLMSSPDFDRLYALAESPPDQVAEWSAEIDRLSGIPQQSYDRLMASIERPMPVWLGEPEHEEGRIYFVWDKSFDLQGDGLTYEFTIANDYHFNPEDVVYERSVLTTNTHDIAALPKGTYYFRLIIRDTKDPVNNWMYAYNYIWAEDRYFEGVKQFTVD